MRRIDANTDPPAPRNIATPDQASLTSGDQTIRPDRARKNDDRTAERVVGPKTIDPRSTPYRLPRGEHI